AEVRVNGWTLSDANKFIEILTDRLSAAAILALHRFGDVYVTISSGEGFDMPAFDAKIAGNLMVYTPSGGPKDFADQEKDIRVEPKRSVVCHSFYHEIGWAMDAEYLDYDVNTVVQGMRLARRAIRSGVRSNADMSSFEASQVGHRMLDHLRAVVGAEGKVF